MKASQSRSCVPSVDVRRIPDGTRLDGTRGAVNPKIRRRAPAPSTALFEINSKITGDADLGAERRLGGILRRADAKRIAIGEAIAGPVQQIVDTERQSAASPIQTNIQSTN